MANIYINPKRSYVKFKIEEYFDAMEAVTIFARQGYRVLVERIYQDEIFRDLEEYEVTIFEKE